MFVTQPIGYSMLWHSSINMTAYPELEEAVWLHHHPAEVHNEGSDEILEGRENAHDEL